MLPTSRQTSHRRLSDTVRGSAKERRGFRHRPMALVIAVILFLLAIVALPPSSWSRRASRRSALALRSPRSQVVGLPITRRDLSMRPYGAPTELLERVLGTPSRDIDGLLGILDELTRPEHRPPNCTLTGFHRHRYSSLWQDKHTTTLIAMDLTSAANVLPSMIRSLLLLLRELGPRRFCVVVYENGSKDASPAMLMILSRLLAAIGASFTITSSVDRSQPHQHLRIQYLSDLRNRLLVPLSDPTVARAYGGFDQILFLNDVVFCPADAMEVLWQRQLQGADMVCGIDFKELKIPEFAPDYPMLFYDTWVARDMLGLPLYEIRQPGGHWTLPSPPFALNPDDRALYTSLSPVQVFSCWNGIAAVAADVFLPPSNLHFHDAGPTNLTKGIMGSIREEARRRKAADAPFNDLAAVVDPPEKVPAAVVVQGAGKRKRALDEPLVDVQPPVAVPDATPSDDIDMVVSRDSQSECFLLCSDLWRIGRGKILLAPRAKVAYEVDGYERVRADNVTSASGKRTEVDEEVDSSLVVHYDGILRVHPRGSVVAREEAQERVVWKLFPPKRVAFYPFADWAEERWIPPY